MVRVIDQESRKKAVLAATINKYIKEPMPVASDEIASEFSLSSATIRNIFAELEENGFLMQPYTSSGRIPTDKGYRYYVDFLLSQIELIGEEKCQIANEYTHEISRVEDVLEKTSEVVSTITRYASIVYSLDRQEKYFYKGISFILELPEFQDLNQIRCFIKMIEEKEGLCGIINRDFSEKVKLYIGEEMGCPEIKNCSLAVSCYKVKKRPVGRLAILGPRRMEYGHIIPTLEYVSDVLTNLLDEE